MAVYIFNRRPTFFPHAKNPKVNINTETSIAIRNNQTRK